MSWPSGWMRPERCASRPTIERKVVDLPAPLRPSNATASPAQDVERTTSNRMSRLSVMAVEVLNRKVSRHRGHFSMTRIVKQAFAQGMDHTHFRVAPDVFRRTLRNQAAAGRTRIRSACSNTTSMSCSVKSTRSDFCLAICAVSRISSTRSRGRHARRSARPWEQFWLVGERNSKLEPLEIAIGQFTRRRMRRKTAHPDKFPQQAVRFALHAPSRATKPRG